MGVIIDTGARNKIDQLEAKGAFSLADTFRQVSTITLESLAFMTSVPAEYQALVDSSSAYQAIRTQHEEKTKESEQEQKRIAARAAFQHQLDETMLRFSFDGHDIEISQGELRKQMDERVKELEKQKKDLLRNGGRPEETQRIDQLLDGYKQAEKHSETGPLDPNEIKSLMQQDPKFAQRIEHCAPSSMSEKTVSSSMRASFSSEAFGDSGISAAPLKTTFSNSASPTQTPVTPTSTPAPEKPQQRLNSTLEAAGF